MTYFRGVPGCVTKCDRGRGSKLPKNSVTYFMDGPLGQKSFSAICKGCRIVGWLYCPTVAVDSVTASIRPIMRKL